MTLGLTGHLLSASFLESRLRAPDAGGPEHARGWRDLAALRRRTASLGPASSPRALLDAGATPLLEGIGLGAPRDVEIAGRLLTATVDAGDHAIALLVAPWGEPLHLYWRSGIEHAMRRSSRWPVLFNGMAVRLLDTSRPQATRFA